VGKPRARPGLSKLGDGSPPARISGILPVSRGTRISKLLRLVAGSSPEFDILFQARVPITAEALEAVLGRTTSCRSAA
jgi:hypothetical protein